MNYSHGTSGNLLRLIVAGVVGVFLFGNREACATNRYYPDLEAKSENGRYLVEAKSPDNAEGGRVAFQDNFTYTLRDLNSDRRVWEWTPAEHPSPRLLHVHDSGAVVIWDAYDEFWILDLKKNSHRVLTLDEYLPREEYDKWVHQTTAGPQWAGLSLWYFCPTDAGLYFVIRTYWDHRIVIDISNRAAVADAADELHRLFDEKETSIIMKTLKVAAESNFLGLDDDDTHFEIRTAAFVAGKLELPRAVPLLQKMEAAASDWTASLWTGEDSNYRISPPRQIAQLSLRRLGTAPTGYPATYVEIEGIEPRPDKPWQVEGKKRHELVAQLGVGMPRKRVLEVIGPPDFPEPWYAGDLDDGDYAWEYDMDPAEPFTLQLIFREDHKLLKANRLPPRWKATGVRDEDLAN